MKKLLSLMTVLLMFILVGCSSGDSSNSKSLIGEWERIDTSSPLYGMIVKVEESSDGYVGKITYLTDVAKDADFKTGMTKWKDINLTETKNQYEFKDFTINALDGEESWSDMIMIFDPAKPDEIKIHSVSDETNFMSSNDQTYRRVK